VALIASSKGPIVAQEALVVRPHCGQRTLLDPVKLG